MKAAEAPRQESRRMACSEDRGNAELATRSCSRGVSLSGQDAAPAETTKELTLSSLSLLKEVSSPAPLHLQNIMLPASVDPATDVV